MVSVRPSVWSIDSQKASAKCKCFAVYIYIVRGRSRSLALTIKYSSLEFEYFIVFSCYESLQFYIIH